MENKALEFDEIASNVFAPIYPVIAKQIVESTGIIRGKCLDLGSGGGHLGIALAQATDLHVSLLDCSFDAIQLAEKRIKGLQLTGRVDLCQGDVHQMSFENESFQLIVSRGSVWFWEDHRKAFGEIRRLLEPGGKAYIGGGFGTEALRRDIVTTMSGREPDWENRVKGYRGRHTGESMVATLTDLGIERNCIKIIDNESGLWILFAKKE